ncbi:GAK system ATP-grasp enzyme [Marinomonas piezotolerans]|uniref:GAK system ATP-grasp enzyme n=1 Tax=Marinomonas piezotolerans TaxID=2213058 RepID=A0A370U6N9_9GAMM|nr:GAK system ATP-grasp enzyme [Marinomonas piezotolerans]RDL43444.1 GAK system ATP-grasp enzyme [Marinomonas piezotolerans]
MSNLKIGVIGIPGKWSTEVLADRLEALTGFRAVIDMADVELCLDTKQLLHKGLDLGRLDGVIVKKISEVYAPSAEDRALMLSHIEAMGVPVFSPSTTIRQMINRLSGTLALQRGGVPMPETRVTESIDVAVSVIKALKEVILKPLYSTKARGMQILNAQQPDSELREVLAAFKQEHGLFYLQKTVELDGRDLGMVFLGGKYICTYARVAGDGSWNTTINSGGHYEAYEPTPELIELGRKAQACYNLSFTTVDIALTSGGPVVFEVSAFGGFKGALEGCGLDVAAQYADYVVAQIQNGKA